MRKDKYRFFKTVGQVTYTVEQQEVEQQTVQQESSIENSPANEDNEMDMFMSLYENNAGAEEIKEANEMYNSYAEEDFYKSNKPQEYKNTDLYIKYEINREMLVTAKEARTTTENKQKFLVSKAPVTFNDLEKQKKQKKQKKHNSIITEQDSIYKMSAKMRKSGLTNQDQSKPIERIGFIVVANTTSQQLSPQQLQKQTQQNKIIGMLEDNKPILKNKPFNSRKLGYLPVNISDTQPLTHNRAQTYENTQQFVEVVEQRDLKWLVLIIFFFFLLAALLKTQDPADWKFNLSNLTLFKTEEQTHTQESSLQLSLNVSPTLKEEDKEQNKYSLNINLSSPQIENENITYNAVLTTLDSNPTVIWSQDNISAGETIEQITVDLTPDQTSNQTIPCSLKVTIYKNGRYIGEMESSLTIHH